MAAVNKQVHFIHGGVKLFSINDVERIIFAGAPHRGYFGMNIANYRRDFLIEGVDYMKLQTSMLSKDILSKFSKQVIRRIPYLYAYTKNGIYKIAGHLDKKHGTVYRANVNTYFTDIEFDKIIPAENIISTINKNIVVDKGVMLFSKSAIFDILNKRTRKIISLNDIIELINKITDEDKKISSWMCLTEYINNNYDGKDIQTYLDIIDSRVTGTESNNEEPENDVQSKGDEMKGESQHSERYNGTSDKQSQEHDPYFSKNDVHVGDKIRSKEYGESTIVGSTLLRPFPDSGIFVKLTGRNKPLFIRTLMKGYSITEIPGDLICISCKNDNYVLPKESVVSISFK